MAPFAAADVVQNPGKLANVGMGKPQDSHAAAGGGETTSSVLGHAAVPSLYGAGYLLGGLVVAGISIFAGHALLDRLAARPLAVDQEHRA